MLDKLKIATAMAAALSTGVAGTAVAFEPGDWLVRVGASNADPASKNHDIRSVLIS